MLQEQIVLDKDAWNALNLACEMAGGISYGPGNPWKQECGCLLSLAAFVDGRSAWDRKSIYEAPADNEPVLSALWESFGADRTKDNDSNKVWGASDSVCSNSGVVLTWEEFTTKLNLVPSK